MASASSLERKLADRLAAYAATALVLLRDSNPQVDYVIADSFDEATGRYECTMHIKATDEGKWADAMIKHTIIHGLSQNTAEMQAAIMLSVAPGGDQALDGAFAGMETKGRAILGNQDFLRDRRYSVQPAGDDGRFVVKALD